MANMAAESGSGKESLPEKSCVSCNRSVKGNTKCVKCDKRYHPACAVRVSGIKVIGSDMIMCPACRENASDNGDVGDNECDEAVKENNKTLTMLVLQMQVSQELLLDKIWTLEERIRQYETISLNSMGNNPQKTYATSTKNTETGRTKQMFSKDPEISDVNTKCINASSSSSSCGTKPCEVRNRYVNNNSTKVNNDHSVINNRTTTLSTEEKSRSIINNKEVNSAILQAEMAAKMTEIINLDNKQVSQNVKNTNSNSVINQEWHNVRHKRRRKFVVGQSENDEVQAIPRSTSLHVTRLRPDTTTDDLQKFLKSKFSNVVCEKHPSRYPQSYTSMKVTILREELKNAWRRKNWPKGALVSHFMERRMPSLTDPQMKSGMI